MAARSISIPSKTTASCTPAILLIPMAMLWERCGWTCPRCPRALRWADELTGLTSQTREARGQKSALQRHMSPQDPTLLRRLLRAKDRMDAASEEDWPVERLAEVSGISKA